MCGSDTFRYIDARPGTNPNDGIVWLGNNPELIRPGQGTTQTIRDVYKLCGWLMKMGWVCIEWWEKVTFMGLCKVKSLQEMVLSGTAYVFSERVS